MSEDALEQRYREVRTPENERAWLVARAQGGEVLPWTTLNRLHGLDPEVALRYLQERVPPELLRLAARHGAELAAEALGESVGAPPTLLTAREDTRRRSFQAWRHALVYLRAIVAGLLDWWGARGPEFRDSVVELTDVLTAIDVWVEGAQTEAATQLVTAQANSCEARAELLDGRHPECGRAIAHLARALGDVARVCTAPGKTTRLEVQVRFDRALASFLEVDQAVVGTVFTERPELQGSPTPALPEEFSARRREFEAMGSRDLACWLLTHPPDADVRAAPARRILYVENHGLFAQTVVRTFLEGHEVTVVPSVAEARAALAEGGFDVALVDEDLDDGKGSTWVRELRAAGNPIKVVAASAHADGNRALQEAGADVVCGKRHLDGIQEVLRQLEL